MKTKWHITLQVERTIEATVEADDDATRKSVIDKFIADQNLKENERVSTNIVRRVHVPAEPGKQPAEPSA